MTELAAIQRAVTAAILGVDPVDGHVARHREQFLLRHVAVLEEDFAAIVHAVGHGAFHELARAYLHAHPPRSFTLRDLGHAFASFLAARDPFLADLARVEWAFVESFDAPDAAPLDPALLAAVPEEAWPQARIALDPSLTRLVLDWPAHDYRNAVRAGEGPSERPPTRRVHVVVHRGTERMRCTEVHPLAFALLDAIADGATLEAACDRVGPPSDAIAGWFRRWTEAGWLSRIYFPPSLP